MGIRKKCLIITLLCFSSLMHASEFMFKHLEVKDGLSNNQVGSPDKPGGLSIQLCKSEKKEFYIRYSS